MMSKQTVLQIWKNKGKILEGVSAFVFKKAHIEEVHDERMAICKACPEIDLVGTKCAMSGAQPCCSNCGCSLKFKLRSMSSACPLNKWTAILTEDEENQMISQINKNK